MGQGIAQATALARYDVLLYDLEEEIVSGALDQIGRSIEKGVSLGKTEPDAAKDARRRVRPTTDLARITEADLVIEAVPEDLELKRRLFRNIDVLAPKRTILASNTSSLSIDALAGATSRPDRFLGLHFFNPAHIMRLVEVIQGEDTSQGTVESATAYVHSLGKTAVHCKDTPAFIVNRVARPFYGEAFRLLGENAANATTIDRLVKSVGFPMGPFELIDLIGCDVNLAVTQSVYEAFYHDPKYRPHPIQRRMVQSGRLGRKSGRGFYSYSE